MNLSRIRTPFLIMALVPLLAIAESARAPAETENSRFSGVWAVVEDQKSEVICYLAGDGSGGRLFDQRWNEVPNGVRFNEGVVRFKLPFKVDGVEFEGQFESGKLAGKWKRFHIQYTLGGEWHGEKLIGVEGWKPWSFLDQDHGDWLNVDLTEAMLKLDAPPDSSDCTRKWSSEVEAKYLAVLTRALYQDEASGIFPIARRKAAVEKACEWWQERSDGDKARIQRFSDTLRRAHEQLKDRYPDFYLGTVAALIPSSGRFDYSYLPIVGNPEEKGLLLISVDWLLDHPMGDGGLAFFSEALLYGAFYERITPTTVLALEFAGRGIARTLSLRLAATEQAAQANPRETVEESAAEHAVKTRLFSDRQKQTIAHFRQYFLSAEREAVLRLGESYAEDLFKRVNPRDLPKLSAREMLATADHFLRP